MSEKYIHDRFLPDKAIDILDEACSRINLENKDLFKLEMLKKDLAKVQAQKDELAQPETDEDFQKVADLKTQECKIMEDIDTLSKKMKPRNLTLQDIATVIENWTKIPVKKITEAETQKLLNLEPNLHKRIIGQEEAVSAVSRAIRRNRAGLQNEKRPPSFIFVGPTGVGKTELAKSLAYEMFGSEDSIIRIDMSEYMESHSTSKLIGAPPGYVGYDEAGQLTEKVKRKAPVPQIAVHRGFVQLVALVARSARAIRKSSSFFRKLLPPKSCSMIFSPAVRTSRFSDTA